MNQPDSHELSKLGRQAVNRFDSHELGKLGKQAVNRSDSHELGKLGRQASDGLTVTNWASLVDRQ